MALQITEFFGFEPGDAAAGPYFSARQCPFIGRDCTKPEHGACSVRQTQGEDIICCPNRMYASDYRILLEISSELFGAHASLIRAADLSQKLAAGETLSGQEIVVFGRHWGQELPLSRAGGASSGSARGNYYMDWILARVDARGALQEFTAVEVQTIDTTGNYREQSEAYFQGKAFTDAQGRCPGFSNAGMNWENVNKRILPQLIYKGHAIRREQKCTKGLFFVCPQQVYDKIRDRLGHNLHEYHPSSGTITFRSYGLAAKDTSLPHRDLIKTGQFTTTVDQVALAFTAPMNLPDAGAYESAIIRALGVN